MKKKMFGRNIAPSCEYCAHNRADGDNVACDKNKTMKPDGGCRSFCYDPLRRIPRPAPKLPTYHPDDFAL